MTHGSDYHALFTILIAISTTMAQTSRPQDGLEYASEPLTLASALSLVKIRDTGTGHPPPDQRQQSGQGPSRQPYCYRGSGSPPLNTTTTLVLLGSLLAAIKGGTQGPQGRQRTTLHRLPSNFDIGTSLNHS
jgi:hypothetical protein